MFCYLITDINISCKVFIFVFSLVCGLSFISGLYGDWQIYSGVKSIENSSQHAVYWVNQIKHNSSQVLEALNIGNTVGNLKNNIEDLNKNLNQDTLEKYIENCQQISNDIDNSRNQVKSANQTLNDVHYEDVPKYVKEYGTMFCIIAVCVLSAMTIVGLVFTFAICSRCLLGCFTILAVLSFILSSLLVGATFATSVGGSDFCLDDKNWMRTKIANKGISDYLIDCVSNNEVSKYMDKAQNFVNNAEQTNRQLNELIIFLDQNCGQSGICATQTVSNIKSNLNDLNTRIDRISKLIKEFKILSKCENINNDVNNTLESICTDIIKGVVMIFFNTIVASICFAVIVFSATFALR